MDPNKMDKKERKAREEEKKKREESQAFHAQITDVLASTQKRVDDNAQGEFATVMEELLVLEKQARMAADGDNTTRLLEHIVKLCVQCAHWDQLVELLNSLSKKRNQIKQGITRMVQQAMEGLDRTPNKQTKLLLINELRKICEGKIYVEVERARLIRMLTDFKVEEGKIDEAAELLQEVQVETIGSMEASEKIEFVLEQMRLCLAKKDYVRAFIISKKITRRTLQAEEHQDLKVRYYGLMIRYYAYKREYLELCKCYSDIYNTPKVLADTAQWVDALQHMIVYIVLSPFDNHQSDMLHRIWDDRRLEEPPLEAHRLMLRQFTNRELIDYPKFEKEFGDSVLRKSRPFQPSSVTGDELASSVSEKDDIQRTWDDLLDRIVENNIRIIAQHYGRIRVARLCELLHLDADKTEGFVSKMVTNGTISAKIDRIDGILNFKKSQDEGETLNAWSNDIVDLLNKVEKTGHLIEAQRSVAKASKRR